MERSGRTVVISGFEPFGGEALNPTAELVADLSWLALPQKWTARAALLPVTFKDAYQSLRNVVEETRASHVIALGLAGGRAKVGLERVAINCIDARLADNAGFAPIDQRVRAGAPDGLFATLPLRRMLDAALAQSLPCEISDSAGTFVCNYLLFRLLDDSRFSARRCGFIHVPYLPQQADARVPAPPAMTLEEMRRTLNVVIGAALDDSGARY